MHTNDSQPITGAVTAPAGAAATRCAAAARFAGEVAAALRGRRDRTTDRRVWPYALAPVVLAAADVALNGPAVLAHDLTSLAGGVVDAVQYLAAGR